MLRELLRGFEARQPQTVANMTVIPLVGQDTEYKDVGTIADIYLERDSAYDRLTMGNEAANVTIMPSGYTLITKEAAQDRAVANKTLIPSKKVMDVNAYCVQSSQAGHMSKGQKEKQAVRMLPATVRKAAYLARQERNYSALWGSLGNYNTALGVKGNFLTSFFEHFKEQLDKFIAEFELVPHQRGAIILINDKVMGVEISPNPMAFSAQWEPLIRDCYGSEAIARQKDYKVIDESAVFGDTDTLEGLSEKLDKFEDKEFEFAEKCVREILDQQERSTDRQSEGPLKVVDVETDDYQGQAVRKNGSIIDLTLLSKDAAQKGFKFARR